jgi:hypothetical protein
VRATCRLVRRRLQGISAPFPATSGIQVSQAAVLGGTEGYFELRHGLKSDGRRDCQLAFGDHQLASALVTGTGVGQTEAGTRDDRQFG